MVVLLIIAAGTGYFVGSANQRTVTSTTTATSSVTTTTTETETSNLGATSLLLTSTVSPETAAQGENVTVVAEVYNPLASSMTVNLTSMINPSQGPCSFFSEATALRVYSGHYTFANLTGAQPVQLYNSSIAIFCPVQFSFVFTFMPHSDNATVQYLPPLPPTSVVQVVRETTVLSGYWSPGLLAGPSSGSVFHAFGPGSYTVVVFDVWGQQLIVYFEVS